MKQLIVDYLPFEIRPEHINESMNENNGKLIVSGVYNVQRQKIKTVEYILEKFLSVRQKNIQKNLLNNVELWVN